MAITNDQFDSTDLAAVINEVWTPIVLEELFPKTVGANFFQDLSQYATEGGDTFHVPDVYSNSFTAKTQSTQGAEIDTESPAMNDITLSVDTHILLVCEKLGELLETLKRVISSQAYAVA